MKCFRIRRWFSNALVGLFSIRLLISFAAIVAASILLSSCAVPGPLKEGMRPTIKSVTIWPTTNAGDPKWYGNSHLVFSTNLCSECSPKLMVTPRDEFAPKELSPPPPIGIGGKPDWAAYWEGVLFGKPDIYDHMMVSHYGRGGIAIHDFKSKKTTPVTNNGKLDLSIWAGPIFVLEGSRIAFAHRDNTGVIKIITIDKDGSNELILMDGIIIEDPKYFWFGMSTNMHGTTLVYTVSNENEALLGEIDLRSRRHATLFKTNEKVGIEPTHPSFFIFGADPQEVIPRGYTASPALNDPEYNKDGSKISYIRSIMGASSWNPMSWLEYEWKTRQLFVYSKATGKIRQVTPDDSVILGSDWYGDELYFIGSIGSQSGLWHTDESGQIKQLLSFVCNKKPRSVKVPPNRKRIAFFCNKTFGSVEFSPNGKYIAFSTHDLRGGMVGIARMQRAVRLALHTLSRFLW